MFPEDMLKNSYAVCARVVRRSGSNLARCFFVLPPPKRRAMEALYAFFRITDDLGDQPASASYRRQVLHKWREALNRAVQQAEISFPRVSDPDFLVQEELFSIGTSFAQVPSENLHSAEILEAEGVKQVVSSGSCSDFHEAVGPAELAILPALVHTVQTFQIPPVYLYAVLEGVCTDVEPQRYETFEDLALYCRRVASAVGLACLCIWGCHRQEAIGPAVACGLALQLTNILRDLKEDALQGRVYLPQSDLAACGYSAEELLRAEQEDWPVQGKTFPRHSSEERLQGPEDDRFHRLMAMEVRRAQEFYGQAAGLWNYLDGPGRRIFGMMYETYRRILERIARRPQAVLAGRVRLTRWEKLGIATRWWICPSRRWLL